MSDAISSLPVKTLNNGDVSATIADGTVPSQLLNVDSSGRITSKLNDGAGNSVTSQANGGQQALDVGIDVAGVQIDPRQIRALTAADVVTANQGAPNSAANGWPVKPTDGTNSQSFTAAGEAKVDITQPLPAGTNAIGTVNVSNLPTTVDTNYGTVGASTLRSAAQVGNATGAADFNFGAASAQTLRAASLIGNATGAADFNYGTVGAQSLRTASQIGNATGAANFNNGATGAQTLRVAANLAVAGADVTALNPVPVVVSGTVSGTIVNNYNTAAAVAAGASSNHTYTITTGKAFQGKKILASSAGSMRVDVQISPDGVTFTTVFTGFTTASDLTLQIDMDQILFLEPAGTGAAIRVIRTNRELLLAENVYSTISGIEV